MVRHARALASSSTHSAGRASACWRSPRVRWALEHGHAQVSDESALVFAGFAAFLDPPKESARAALAALAQDHVDVKVISGDNELVTAHICAQVGLPAARVLTGAQIAAMSEPALAASVEKTNLFCRVSPSQKHAIIRALQRRGHVVGYLGDGINDAPSLHAADVGISVDSAVDVAKAAADMILMKHDLRVLHSGVLEGRRTFGNIMKYIMMGTSSNFGNMFSMAGAALLLPFLPMLPIQILLNNLLYDLSELPIPLDRVDQEYLGRPRHWDMAFIRNFMLVIGPVSSLFDFLIFYIMLALFHADATLFHTGWFIESIASQVLVIFIVRTRKNPLRSRAHPWLVGCSLSVVAFAAALPFTPLGAPSRLRGAARRILPGAGRHAGALPALRGMGQTVVLPPLRRRPSVKRGGSASRSVGHDDRRGHTG